MNEDKKDGKLGEEMSVDWIASIPLRITNDVQAMTS